MNCTSTFFVVVHVRFRWMKNCSSSNGGRKEGKKEDRDYCTRG